MASITRSVNDIIDSLVAESKQNDSYLSNTPRWAIQKWVRSGLQEITEKYVSQVRALRLPVTVTSNSVELPLDYVKLLRISEFTENGVLIPIGVDASIMSGNEYLLDNLDNILLDSDGIALLGSADTGINREYYTFDYTSCPYYGSQQYYNGGYSDYAAYWEYYNMNNTFAPAVRYTLDEFNNKIQLSGRNVGEVMVEYSFNPIMSVGSMSDLQIHRYFADALERYAYNELVAKKRSVPLGEKERARRDYREALMLARLTKDSPSINAITFVTNLK